MQPLVSAMMPTYNSGATLKKTIDSVVAQTYLNWELIIVDDGSSDNTRDIVKSYGDKRIKYFYQKNQGRGAARNKCVKESAGEYIVVVDSDDISLPDRFKLQVEFLEKNKNVGVVSGQVLFFSEGVPPRELVTYPNSSPEILEYFRKGKMGISNAASMVRKTVFDKVGLYAEDCLRAQDLEFFIRASKYTEFHNLDKVILHYNNEPKNTSYKFWKYLHSYHDYAVYRATTINDGKVPLPYSSWVGMRGWGGKVRSIYHLIRFLKTKIKMIVVGFFS